MFSLGSTGKEKRSYERSHLRGRSIVIAVQWIPRAVRKSWYFYRGLFANERNSTQIGLTTRRRRNVFAPIIEKSRGVLTPLYPAPPALSA